MSSGVAPPLAAMREIDVAAGATSSGRRRPGRLLVGEPGAPALRVAPRAAQAAPAKCRFERLAQRVGFLRAIARSASLGTSDQRGRASGADAPGRRAPSGRSPGSLFAGEQRQRARGRAAVLQSEGFLQPAAPACVRAALRAPRRARAAARAPAGAPPRWPRTGPGRPARSARCAWRRLHGAHAALAQMAREDAVMVVVEARRAARLQQLGELGVASAPLPRWHQRSTTWISVASRAAVLLDDAERPGMRPVERLQRAPAPRRRARGAGGCSPCRRRRRRTLPTWWRKQAPVRPDSKPSVCRQRPMLVGEPAQRLQRRAPGAEHAVDVRQGLGVDLVAPAQDAGACRRKRSRTGASGALQLAVVGRRSSFTSCASRSSAPSSPAVRCQSMRRTSRASSAFRAERRPAEMRQHARAHATGSCRRRAARRLRRRRGRRPAPPGSRRSRARSSCGGSAGCLRDLARRDRQDLLAVLARGDAQELPHRVGVAQRRGGAPGSRGRGARSGCRGCGCALAGIQAARQAHRAQRLRRELEAGALELAAQEAVVEARVVGDEHAPGKALVSSPASSAKRGAAATISLVMPVSAWIGAGMPVPGLTSVDHSRGDLEAVDLDDGDLGDAVGAGCAPVVSRSTMASGASSRRISLRLDVAPSSAITSPHSPRRSGCARRTRPACCRPARRRPPRSARARRAT